MRPFKVLGIQQIAIGNESKARLEKFWVEIMGLEKTGTFMSERENVDEDILRIGRELMQLRLISCNRWMQKNPPGYMIPN